jgi:hypothetical protein
MRQLQPRLVLPERPLLLVLTREVVEVADDTETAVREDHALDPPVDEVGRAGIGAIEGRRDIVRLSGLERVPEAIEDALRRTLSEQSGERRRQAAAQERAHRAQKPPGALAHLYERHVGIDAEDPEGRSLDQIDDRAPCCREFFRFFAEGRDIHVDASDPDGDAARVAVDRPAVVNFPDGTVGPHDAELVDVAVARLEEERGFGLDPHPILRMDQRGEAGVAGGGLSEAVKLQKSVGPYDPVLRDLPDIRP